MPRVEGQRTFTPNFWTTGRVRHLDLDSGQSRGRVTIEQDPEHGNFTLVINPHHKDKADEYRRSCEQELAEAATALTGW